MASSYSTSLRLEHQATGENRSSWGNKTNTNLSLIEEAVSGYKNIVMVDANLTLTKVNGGTDQSRPMMLVFTSSVSLTVDRIVTLATVSKVFIAYNGTTGGKNVILSTGATNGSYTLPPGQWKMFFTGGAALYSSDDLATVSTAAHRFGISPEVDIAGVMEVGRMIDFHNTAIHAGDWSVRLGTGDTTTDMYIQPSAVGASGGKIWHSGNTGSGSGMDADLLDGKHASEIQFAAGTTMLFHANTAPVGWVKNQSWDNRALRLVNGSVNMTAGGTVGFTTALTTAVATSAVSLTVAQMPTHAHSFSDTSSTTGGDSPTHTHALNGVGAATTGAGAHTHNVKIYSGEGGGSNRIGAAASDTASHIGNQSTDGISATHVHDLEGNTAGRSVGHTHTVAVSGTTGNQGSGTTHAHTVDLNLQYVDVLFCTKS